MGGSTLKEECSFMWMKELFGVEKPIIAMCHMQPMPGDPAYDADGGMEKVLECARKDLLALQEGGVDGVMFSNEFSLPYLTKVETVTVASMAAVIGELKSEIKIPYGVNCLWDPVASIDLAVAVGGKFIREIITGVYASDFGLWNTNVGATVRHKMAVSGKDIKMLCVSGLTAGSETDTQILMRVKNAVKHTPVLCNTGCNKDNIKRQLQYSDGAVCATTFKVDGIFENPVDVNRVKEFMAEVKDFRAGL